MGTLAWDAAAAGPIVLAHEPAFRLGGAEFHPATREAVADGRRTVIEPRVMQMLVALHRADGGVVTKDELILQCWDGRVVGEDAINRVVSRLRSASEKIGNPFRVETITKVGYRLAPANGDVPGAAATPEPSRWRFDRRQLMIGGTAAAAVAAGAFAWNSIHGDELPREARLLVEDAQQALKTDEPDQLANGVGQLRRAAELAPASALVWGLMALGYMRQMISAPPETRADLRTRGTGAARRALSIDPDQPDARAAQIYTLQRYRNWFAHEQACWRALRTHPDHFELNMLLGGTLSQVGRFAELLPRAQRCMQQAPMYPAIHLGLAGILYDLGRVDEAEAAYDRAFALWPRKTGVWFSRFYFLMYNHRADEALTMARNSAKRPLGLPDRNFDLIELKAAALTSGDPAQLRAALAEWERAATTGTGFAENAVKFAAHLGDHDMVFRILDRLYFGRGVPIANVRFGKEQGHYSGPERNTYFLFWRVFREVRRDPRFERLVRDLGLVDYWARSGSRNKIMW